MRPFLWRMNCWAAALFFLQGFRKGLRENEGMSYGAGTFMNAGYKNDVTIWGLYAAYNPMYKGRLDSALHQEIDKAMESRIYKR
jgi:hypothetical protein